MPKTSEGLAQLKNRIQELEEQLAIKDKLFFMLEEAIPEGETGRKKYMSDIALFYSSVFKDKLKHFIGSQLEELAQIGRTELGTNIIRSNINCFRLIDEWMLKRTNEHIGNVEMVRQRMDENKEFISNIKNKYENKTN